MTDLNTTNFKTGTNVTAAEIHTAVFDISTIEFVPAIQYPYSHITSTTMRVGTANANYENGAETNHAIVSSRAYASDTSYVDFDISLDDGSFNLLIRPDGNDPIPITEPTDELIASYVRRSVGRGSEHMMSSSGCFSTYIRPSFSQIFRAEESGTVSTIKINEDFVEPGSTVNISICEMKKDSAELYTMVNGMSAVLLTGGSTDTRERFGVPTATDISCISFDVSGSGFSISQNSLYMMTFDGSFCDMGIWGTGMSMLDMEKDDNSNIEYKPTNKKPYPIEILVKSTSVSGRTDSGTEIQFSRNKLKIEPDISDMVPHIDAIYKGVSGNIREYDIITGFTAPYRQEPYPVLTKCQLIRISHNLTDNTFRVEGVRTGSYGNTSVINIPRAVATKDRFLTTFNDKSVLIMSYFDISTNAFRLLRYSVDDLLYHPPVFDDTGNNPYYQDAVGDNTMYGFVERLDAIGRSADMKQHTVSYDGESNSGMRMVCDAVNEGDDQWVAYTDLRYATNTDANVYMVNMSAADPDATKFHVSLRNPLPKALLSYQYYIATFPTISMCKSDGGNMRYLSVGRHVYAYDTRANTMTFVSADISVYRVNTIVREATYVATVESADTTGTKMPGFSQYVNLIAGLPFLHYTTTDVSGTAWGAKELKQPIDGVLTSVPLNNHHMFQDNVLYDSSNSVVDVRYIYLGGPITMTSSTPFHADVSGNLNVTGECYANKFVARHTDANSVNVNHSLWANRVEAASISIGGVELTKDTLERLLGLLD